MVKRNEKEKERDDLGLDDSKPDANESPPVDKGEESEESKPEIPSLEEMTEAARAKADAAFMKDYEDVRVDDLISLGYVRHTFQVVEGLDITIRTLRKKEELDIKKRIGEYNGAHVYILDETNSNTLGYCILEINGEPLPKEFVDRREIVDNLSDVVAVDIIDKFRDLNKALVILMKGSSKNSLARRLLGPEQI